MGMRASLAVAITINLVAGPVWGAEIGSGVDQYGSHYLTLDGPIVPRDPERLAALIVEANARGYRLDALRLNSPGGFVWETMAMAVMVRWVENLATAVYKKPSVNPLASGCLPQVTESMSIQRPIRLRLACTLSSN